MPTWIGEVPRDNGAQDLEDSARLAGMMAVARESLPLPFQYLNLKGELVRWRDSRLPFTRDQLIPLAYYYTKASFSQPIILEQFRKKLREAADSYWAPNRRDWLAPHHRCHLKYCAYGTPWTLWGRMWLVGEILFQTVTHSEPNQLVCMLLTANMVHIWKKINSNWRNDLRKYWCGWRQESELCEKIIKELE